MIPFRWRRPVGAALAVAALAVLATVPSPAKDKRLGELTPEHQQWLEEAGPLISDEEREAFLELAEDYQRDAFIRRFWQARDTRPSTTLNEFKERYYARLEEARERFGGLEDGRGLIYVLNGEPASIEATDCGFMTWPLEFWRYSYSEVVGRGFHLIFYQPWDEGPFRIWRPAEGTGILIKNTRYAMDTFEDSMLIWCAEMYDDVDYLLAIFRDVEHEGPEGVLEAERPPAPADPEWLATFRAYSTDAAAGEPLSARLEVAFPGRHRSRVVVEGVVLVAASETPPSEPALPEAGAHFPATGDGEPAASAEGISAGAAGDAAEPTVAAFQITGEVLRGSELFESFRYRYDLPVVAGRSNELPLAFERYLRPGSYRLIVKVEDLGGGRVFREEREIEVPELDAVAATRPDEESLASDDLADQPADPASTEPLPAASIRLHSPGEIRSGYVRFDAQASGEAIRKVTFLLDGRAVLSKTRPPYSVELDLGPVPLAHTLRVNAYDEGGRRIATDEILINPGEHAFALRIVEPENGTSHRDRVRVRAEARVPEGERVEQVEIFVDERRAATLFQPPYVQTVELPGTGELAFIRAVASLADGNSTEDLVLLNVPGFTEAVEVRMVELYVTAVDGAGRAVRDLERGDLQVLEDGAAQELLRFERLDDLPIYAVLLVDTSASMLEQLEEVQRVARRFFEETLAPRDRAAIITFSERPRVVTKFTSDAGALGRGLAGLRAERGTALFDSLVFALYHFQGIRGQKALIVLSDGKDQRSERTFEEALDYARTADVTVYSIGLKVTGRARSQLVRLAEETGGRAFIAKTVDELGAFYEAIQRDLRSRYLLAYQAPDPGRPGLRSIEVRTTRPGVEPRTRTGYLP